MTSTDLTVNISKSIAQGRTLFSCPSLRWRVCGRCLQIDDGHKFNCRDQQKSTAQAIALLSCPSLRWQLCGRCLQKDDEYRFNDQNQQKSTAQGITLNTCPSLRWRVSGCFLQRNDNKLNLRNQKKSGAKGIAMQSCPTLSAMADLWAFTTQRWRPQIKRRNKQECTAQGKALYSCLTVNCDGSCAIVSYREMTSIIVETARVYCPSSSFVYLSDCLFDGGFVGVYYRRMTTIDLAVQFSKSLLLQGSFVQLSACSSVGLWHLFHRRSTRLFE